MTASNKITIETSDDGSTRVHWSADGRRLESHMKQIVSPEFTIELPGLGPAAFKFAIFPKAVNDQKHGSGFKKAKGKGRVVIKCEEHLPEGTSDAVMRFLISIGSGGKQQPLRGPVTHDFSEQPCGGLASCNDEWSFTTAVDESGIFVVSFLILPTAENEASH